jgi:hypothetical protein
METGDFVLDVLHKVEDHIEDLRADTKREILTDLIRNLQEMKREIK